MESGQLYLRAPLKSWPLPRCGSGSGSGLEAYGGLTGDITTSHPQPGSGRGGLCFCPPHSWKARPQEKGAKGGICSSQFSFPLLRTAQHTAVLVLKDPLFLICSEDLQQAPKHPSILSSKEATAPCQSCSVGLRGFCQTDGVPTTPLLGIGLRVPHRPLDTVHNFWRLLYHKLSSPC